MSHRKKWKVLGKFGVPHSAEASRGKRSSEFVVKDLMRVLLKNRGLKTRKEVAEFLDPKLENVTVDSVGVNKKQLRKALDRIQKAIKNNEQIIVFGDYDVDGICGTAILWETLHSLKANVLPYIPHRVEEGYGLSLSGISNVKSQMSNVQLIITVDNGIVANEAVEFANKNGIDVIITDHHVPSKKLPNAYAIVHTTKLCGAGVAYLLSQNMEYQILNIKNDKKEDSHLELVALATIADLVPLIGANRTLTKFGLEKLRNTKRVGLLELFQEAIIEPATIGVYEVGHVVAPRLNAMGRIEHAMDSLRLLCTKDTIRAKHLAHKLGSTNRERQRVTEETALHAVSEVRSRAAGIASGDARQKSKVRKLLFIAHESYQQGVIGLVASKLVEEFYRPAIVVSKGEKYSKASARSVHGFNIIEFIRSASEYLVDAGGHPMAAGFTVETEKLPLLQKALEGLIHKRLDGDLLTRTLRVDYELPLSFINEELYKAIQQFAPFGMGNPEPTFVARNLVIEDMRLVGKDGRHLKINVKCQMSNVKFDTIAFGMGERAGEFHIGDTIDVVYTIDENHWNENKTLQLKIKDMKKS